jgi:hypothetical protein
VGKICGSSLICQIDSSIDCSNSFKNSYTLSRMKVEHGMLQGSVFGPLLFLLYINELQENVQGAKLVLFADDTNLLIAGKHEFDLKHKIINIMN